MSRFFTVSICTVLIIIFIYLLNFGAFETNSLPYDDEQTGIDEQVIIHFSHVVAEMQQWQFEQSQLINTTSLKALHSLHDVYLYEPTAEQLAEWKALIQPLYETYRSNGFDHYYSILLEQLHEQN